MRSFHKSYNLYKPDTFQLLLKKSDYFLISIINNAELIILFNYMTYKNKRKKNLF